MEHILLVSAAYTPKWHVLATCNIPGRRVGYIGRGKRSGRSGLQEKRAEASWGDFDPHAARKGVRPDRAGPRLTATEPQPVGSVGTVGAVGLLSELSERGMTVTAHGHCRASLSGCRSCCRTTVGLLSDYCRTVGLCRTPVGSYCRPVGPGLRRRISHASWRAPHGQMCVACVFIGLMCEWRSVRGLWYPYDRAYHVLPIRDSN